MAEVEGEIGNEAASGAAPRSSFVSLPLVGIKSRSSSTLDANRRTIICIGPAIVAGAVASTQCGASNENVSGKLVGCGIKPRKPPRVPAPFHAIESDEMMRLVCRSMMICEV